MQPAAWRPVSVRSILNCQKNKKYDFHENGERAGNLLPNREALARYRRRSPDQEIKGMKSLCKDTDKRQSAKRLYIHQVALLPLNLRTVSPIYGETSKCALLLFWFYKFRSQKAS